MVRAEVVGTWGAAATAWRRSGVAGALADAGGAQRDRVGAASARELPTVRRIPVKFVETRTAARRLRVLQRRLQCCVGIAVRVDGWIRLRVRHGPGRLDDVPDEAGRTVAS